MTQPDSQSRPQKQMQSKSLYDLGFFDTREKRNLTRTLLPLGISKHRPLILSDSSVVLRLNESAILLPRKPDWLAAPANVICGWKDKDTNGDEEFCLGIMDEQATIAGEYYQCRKHPDSHRTLK